MNYTRYCFRSEKSKILPYSVLIILTISSLGLYKGDVLKR